MAPSANWPFEGEGVLFETGTGAEQRLDATTSLTLRNLPPLAANSCLKESENGSTGTSGWRVEVIFGFGSARN